MSLDGQVDSAELAALLEGRHAEPHRVLGPHRVGDRFVVRVRDPFAEAGRLRRADGRHVPLVRRQGLLVAELDADPGRYQLELTGEGRRWERGDPYAFPPSLGEQDLYFFGKGEHRRLWQRLGARPLRHEGQDGWAFAVWAPNARRISLVGDFCAWDGRCFPMRVLGSSGVWELFLPWDLEDRFYKFEIVGADRSLVLKSDPMAQRAELPPGNASRTFVSRHAWADDAWLGSRAAADPRRLPLSVCEVHLETWARTRNCWDYRALADGLVDHLLTYGFTHLELMPVLEHPFPGSWGYQVTGYYAPTGRFGDPDGLRVLVDRCHGAGIGVILDWVPAHFPDDDFALHRFDGTALYEHADPRRGRHPDWGTAIFDLGRHEVRNFLIANALYWLHEFHVDGLRVDAVSSMLYRDYSRAPGEWIPNAYGGREDLEAIAFFRELSGLVRDEVPGAMLIAEESTSFPGVTHRPEDGGLGFTFKWNMGWMHDTLQFFARDPAHRRWHQDDLCFAMLYEGDEAFLMPLSHDEVVHGKGSLLGKMPGDPWQRFANLRLLLAYQFTRPGKKLLFMGTELAPWEEWSHDRPLPAPAAGDALRQGLPGFVAALGALYRSRSPLWRHDHDGQGFEWIDHEDHEHSVLTYLRRDGEWLAAVALNLTPVPRNGYRIGLPRAGTWRLILDSDARGFGGSGYLGTERFVADGEPWHGRPCSILVDLPPLAALVLEPDGDA